MRAASIRRCFDVIAHVVGRMLPRIAKLVSVFVGLLTIAACSVFGEQAVPEPEYSVFLAEEHLEVRDYGELIVVKTALDDGSSAAFGRLFGPGTFLCRPKCSFMPPSVRK
jgi:hypothetical protein